MIPTLNIGEPRAIPPNNKKAPTHHQSQHHRSASSTEIQPQQSTTNPDYKSPLRFTPQI